MIYPALLILFLPGVFAISQEELDCINMERAPVENPRRRIITVTEKNPAYLHCVVPDGTNHMPAWSRLRDRAYLTAGLFVFQDANNVQVSKKSDNDWVLIFRNANRSHAGCYLCEVNTEPESVIYPVYLNVQPAASATTASTSGARDEGKLMANMEGAELVLNCTIKVDATIGNYDIIWTKGNFTIPPSGNDKYIIKAKRSSSDVLVQTMRVKDAKKGDDGEYSCTLPNKNITASQLVNLNSNDAFSRNFISVFTLISLLFALFNQ